MFLMLWWDRCQSLASDSVRLAVGACAIMKGRQ